MKPFKGQVTSAKTPKTVVVQVVKIKVHPLYKKRIKRLKKYHVHDEMGANPGDYIEFVSTKPWSRTKKWLVTRVIKEEK